MRGEHYHESPNSKTVATPLPAVPDRLIQRRKPEEPTQQKLGAYALAIQNGDVSGLIGSDIFPDEQEELAQ